MTFCSVPADNIEKLDTVITRVVIISLVFSMCIAVWFLTKWGVYATLMNVFGDFLTTAVVVGFTCLIYKYPLEALASVLTDRVCKKFYSFMECLINCTDNVSLFFSLQQY